MTTVARRPPGRRPDAVARDGGARAAGPGSFKGVLGAVRRLRGRETQPPGRASPTRSTGCCSGCASTSELSSGELASLADLSPATATQMLDGLEAAGLVKRQRSEAIAGSC